MAQNQTDNNWSSMPVCTSYLNDGKSITCCGTAFSTVAAINLTNGVFSGNNPIALIILFDVCLVLFGVIGKIMDRKKMFVL